MAIQVSNDPDAFHSFEQSGWNDASEVYERAIGPLTQQSAGAILNAAGVTAGSTVLDVCTGHGALARVAAAHGGKVCALDFADKMLLRYAEMLRWSIVSKGTRKICLTKRMRSMPSFAAMGSSICLSPTALLPKCAVYSVPADASQ